MKISRFMNEYLFHEERGYYRTKNPIGKDSDFITSPEISQTFGELIAAYFLEISSHKKSKISLVEAGAGKGTLLFDILNCIRKLAEKGIVQALDFIDRAEFHIIEINEVLVEIQKEKLSKYKISWHKNFEEFSSKSKNREIFFLANELFDCFPIDQFVKTKSGWQERIVISKDEKMEFELEDFSKEKDEFVKKLLAGEADKATLNSVFEYSHEAENFMAKLCDWVNLNGGIALIIDYGYAKSEFANTLQSVKNHKKCDILENAGSADITALVDFSLLQKIAEKQQLNFSLISQRDFLIQLGIEERRAILLRQKSDKEQQNINSSIDRLIDKNQMGELFKCLILWK